MEKNIEIHPNWYKDIPKIKTLILGSFPPHSDKHDYPFYYPNSQNNFWKILSIISNKPLQYLKTKKEDTTIKTKAVHERYDIMKQLNVGVQNIGLEISRIGKSAKDTDIEITKYQDILSIIHSHKELERILLPGFSAPNSTFRAFVKYLELNNINVEVLKPSPEKSFNIQIENRIIECVILNSTSRASRVTINTLTNQFKKSILM